MNFRSPALLRSAKDRPCVMCDSRGSTVACHANWSEFGKGMGLRAEDCFVAFLCQSCHDIIDGRSGKMDRSAQKDLWIQAWIKTISLLFREGIVVVK